MKLDLLRVRKARSLQFGVNELWQLPKLVGCLARVTIDFESKRPGVVDEQIDRVATVAVERDWYGKRFGDWLCFDLVGLKDFYWWVLLSTGYRS
jgi:hypothetical protein